VIFERLLPAKPIGDFIMNPQSSVFMKWTLVNILFLLPFFVLSQENLGRQTILQFDANHQVLNPAAPLLKQSVPMSRGRSSAAFLGGVGGVSFDQVAVTGENVSTSNLLLSYNETKEDGYRLEMMVDNKVIKAYLPDWLLVPIARYAESPYYSCVTIFGDLDDKILQEKLVAHEGRAINYHPAFDNTLLGVRLLYMDMLVGYEFTSDLPSNSEGQYILGAGEKTPDIRANQEGAYYLSQHMISAGNKYKETFRSYVISDFSQKITFDITGDSLVITGSPYYYCWHFNRDREDYDINKVASETSAKYNKEIGQISKTSGNAAVQDWLIDRLIKLADRYNDNFSFYGSGTFVDLVNIQAQDKRTEFLMKYDLESLFQMAVETEAHIDADSIIYLQKYSDLISSKPELFEAANPAVWNATVSTMRYAAFFRYVKNNFPETWLAFFDKLKDLDPEPRIITPTIMYDPDSKSLEEAIHSSLKK
jgi:hypothetical protein